MSPKLFLESPFMSRLKFCFYKSVLLGLGLVILTSLSPIHPLKMSTGVVRETPRGLFVRVKLFADDFENRLNELSNKKIDLSDGLAAYETKSIGRYVNQHLRFALNGTSIPMSSTHVKIIENGLVVEVEMEFNVERNLDVNTLQITNDLMFEVFDNQRNSLVVKINDEPIRLDFEHSDSKNEITWNK